MAADIGEGAKLLIGTADDDDAFADIVEAVPVSRIGHIGDMADNLPTRAENAVDFHACEFAIVIGPGRKAPAIQRDLSYVESVYACHDSAIVIRVYNNMQAIRSPFTRESADTRRDALIAACATSLAQNGVQGTSVRVICTVAGADQLTPPSDFSQKNRLQPEPEEAPMKARVTVCSPI